VLSALVFLTVIMDFALSSRPGLARIIIAIFSAFSGYGRRKVHPSDTDNWRHFF